MVEGGLEKKLKWYNWAVAGGQLVGLAATAGAVYLGINAPELISNYIPFGQALVSSNLGLFGLGMISNFIGDQLGFGGFLRAFNSKRYKGISGTARFFRDYYELGKRHFASYLITYPAAGLVTAALLGAGLTGTLAFTLPFAIVESVLTGLGYIASTYLYRRGQPAYAPS